MWLKQSGVGGVVGRMRGNGVRKVTDRSHQAVSHGEDCGLSEMVPCGQSKQERTLVCLGCSQAPSDCLWGGQGQNRIRTGRFWA